VPARAVQLHPGAGGCASPGRHDRPLAAGTDGADTGPGGGRVLRGRCPENVRAVA